jgi:hypothetical protein
VIKALVSVDMTPTQGATGGSDGVGGAEPGSRLISEWAVCGIAAAAARFIPVPLLDDAVKHRATQVAVVRTLRAGHRAYSSDAVEPLYAGIDAASASTARRALAYLRTVPRRILLFPVRKYVALFGSVRGVPTDVMTVVLLGRSLHRVLDRGGLVGDDETALRAEAAAVRGAFDAAVKGMDLRLFTGALADGLSQGRELTSAAVGYARRTFGRDEKDDAVPALDPGGPVGAGAEKVEEVMRRPEIARLLDEFDRTFDAELAKGRRPGR